MFIARSEPDVYESDGGGGVDVTERINICIISRHQNNKTTRRCTKLFSCDRRCILYTCNPLGVVYTYFYNGKINQ